MKRREFIAGIASTSVPWLFRPARAEKAATSSATIFPVGFNDKCGYRLVKNWDFTKAIRDLPSLRREFYTRYIYNDGTLDHLSDEWSRYRDNNNHMFIQDGLALTARAAVGPLRPGSIESGMLRSRWTGQYGVFEIRMKVPKGRGLFPAFWLNPEDKRWPPEIDVVEIVNSDTRASGRSYHFLHGAGATNSNPRVLKLNRHHAYEPGFDYADAFHTFSVEWTANNVRHLVDGIVVCDRLYRWIHKDGTDGGSAHVLVNLSVGGHWPGAPEERALPAMLAVQHIRVWQR